MKIFPALCVGVATAVGLAACIDDGAEVGADDGEPATVAQDSTVANGVSSNGVSMNGVSMNGVAMNGHGLNGVSFSGATLAGATLSGVALTGGMLTATTGGVALPGASMIGAVLRGKTSGGLDVYLRIDDAKALASDTWAYKVVASGKLATGWKPICANTDGFALVLAGRWDYRDGVAGAGGPITDATQFTFACREASIAKCIELGYAPWRAKGTTNLANHHTACVRMLRGDYCGDGHAYTQTGNVINVYDALGIQTDAKPWGLDAEWTAAGSRCLAVANRAGLAIPSCALSKIKLGCGTFSAGALLINEYNFNL